MVASIYLHSFSFLLECKDLSTKDKVLNISYYSNNSWHIIHGTEDGKDTFWLMKESPIND